MIHIRRVYESLDGASGSLFLVDRLWPRGVKKETLPLTRWLKEVAPSNELRRWYHRDPNLWNEFRQRYFAELGENMQAWAPLVDAACHGDITLLYSSQDRAHNNAVALREFLEIMMQC